MLRKEPSKWLTLLTALFFIGMGMQFFFRPAAAFNRLSIVFGILLAIIGIVQLINFYVGFRRARRDAAKKQPSVLHLVTGLVTIVFGALLISQTWVIIASMQLLFALYALLLGIVKLVVAVQYKLDEEPTWPAELFVGIASIAFGVLLLAVARFGEYAVAIITGVYLTLYGLYGFADFIRMVVQEGREADNKRKD